MYRHNIAITNIETARKFVVMTSKYPDIKILLHSNEYAIDAHSIIGILSLDLSKPLSLEAEGGDIDSFINDVQPYTV